MVNVHEVFSTSITLDEVEKANQEFNEEINASSDAVHLCHASTLLPLKHERSHHVFIPFSPLICAFYAGSSKGKGDSCIYLVRIEADGSHSSVQKLDCPKLNQQPNSTPILFYLNQGIDVRDRLIKADKHHAPMAKGGIVSNVEHLIDDAHKNFPDLYVRGTDDSTIALVYRAGQEDGETVSYLSLSFNDGKYFITPRQVAESVHTGRGPVRTKPYLVRKGPYSGRMIFPSSVDSNEGLAFVDYSDDDLRTINKSNEITPSVVQKEASAKSFFANGVVVSALFEDLGVHQREDNDLSSLSEDELDAKYSKVHMLMSAAGAQVHVADSLDAGSSFGEPYPVPLYNCNAGIDCATYQNRLLVCGKLVTDASKCSVEEGAPLAIYMSKDGKNFSELFVLEHDPKGVYTSPYMQVDRRHHLLYVTYTDHRKAIKIRIFRLMVGAED